jgi:hypothetical protein
MHYGVDLGFLAFRVFMFPILQLCRRRLTDTADRPKTKGCVIIQRSPGMSMVADL